VSILRIITVLVVVMSPPPPSLSMLISLINYHTKFEMSSSNSSFFYYHQARHKTNIMQLPFCCFNCTKLYLKTLFFSDIYDRKSFLDPALSGASVTSTPQLRMFVYVITADYMNLKLLKTTINLHYTPRVHKFTKSLAATSIF
jgi:hypothetical protein